MNKDIKERLSKYESSLREARGLYYRALLREEVDELVEIGQDLGVKLESRGCPRCLLAFLQKLSDLYFAQEVEEVKEEEVTPTTSQKRTRKRK